MSWWKPQSKAEAQRAELEKEKNKQAALLESSYLCALNTTNTSIMMVDLDLNLIFVNDKSEKMLKLLEPKFQTVWPQFKGEKSWLIGQCIDQFHKKPSHQRQLLSSPDNLPWEGKINIDGTIVAQKASAIFDPQGQYIASMLEWEDVTEQLKLQTYVGRMSSAIKGMTTNIMMADNNFDIVYINPALTELFSERETILQSVFPEFNMKTLVGSSIDIFHKHPEHQRAILSNHSRLPFTAEIKVADLEFRLTAIAMKDGNGEPLGAALQWEDITEQNDAQRQVESLISNAISGQLESRIDTSNYSGFMEKLADGINQLLEAITPAMNGCIDVMSGVAKGNLMHSMSDDYQGAFADLASAVNTSVKNLRDMVGQITETGTRVTGSATEISEGNTDLSQRTEEQASSLQQTAASMEQLTGTVKQNAEDASRANELANNTMELARKGGDVVSDAVDAMDDINTASKKIADIIGVIDEIAFQTNLLALNAAVEAARAGEQGRGFAVVASEVRSLAMRSADAAKEIKGLITDSVEKVAQGSKLVDESGKTLSQIVNAVERVTSLVSNIDTASHEQANGIDEVSCAVSQMDEMTQQNAALVEQAAASSESLKDEANSLQKLIEFFQLDTSPVMTVGNVVKTPPQHVEQEQISHKQAQPDVSDDEQHLSGEWKEF